ncbi:MAG: PAS domain S-box protein [Chromatiales bacterium]|nr:PAS domain S-box protein [Chromatiales bacterium]
MLLFAVFSALWILVSDWVLGQLVDDAATIAWINPLKGWAYVAITASLLYLAMRRWLGPTAIEGSASTRGDLGWRAIALPMGLVVLAITAVTAGAIAFSMDAASKREAARVEAIARLRVTQLRTWFEERARFAEILRSSTYVPALYRRWRDQNDAEAGETLRSRLAEFAAAHAFDGIALVDASGEWVHPNDEMSRHPTIRAHAVEAAAATTPTGISAIPVSEPGESAHVDLVVPLQGGGMPAPAAVVLHVDIASTVEPMLRDWPAPTQTGVALLVRRVGDSLVGPRGRHALPLSSPDLLVARAIRGEIPFGAASTARDFRGEAVIGVVYPVVDDEWYLSAKVDLAEVRAAAMRDALWIAFSGVLGLFVAGVGAWLFRERQRLRFALHEQAHQQRRLREMQLLDAVAEASPDAIYAKDVEGRYQLYNSAAARMSGHPRETVIGQDDRALFPTETAELLIGEDKVVLVSGQVHDFEERVTLPIGDRTLHTTKGPLRDPAGRISGVFGITRDVTDLYRVRAELRESEARFRELADSLPQLVWTYGPDGDLRFVNRQWTEYTGLDLAATEAADWTSWIHPDDQESVESAWACALETGTDFRCEYRIRRHDGTWRWFDGRAACLKDARGQVRGWYGSDTDVHETREAREALAREQARFSRLVAAAPPVIHTFCQHPDGRVTFPYVGPGITDIYGVSPEALAVDAAPAMARIHPDDAERLWASIDEAARSMGPWHGEFRVSHPQRGLIHVEGHSMPERDADGSLLWHGVLIDVTNQRHQERELERAREREQSALDAAGMMAWEYRPQAGVTVHSANATTLGYGSGPVDDFLALAVAEDRQSVADAMEAAREAEAYEHEYRARDASGRLRWLLDKGAWRRDPETGEEVLAGVTLDVTERHTATEELIKLSLAVEQSPNPVMITDVDARIEYVNRAFLTTTGYARVEVIGRNPRFMRAPDAPAETAPAMWATILRGEVWRGEFRNRRRDGTAYVAAAMVAPVRQRDGRISHYVGLEEDVTERKRLEAEVETHRGQLEALVARRTRELADANRELAEKASEVAALNDELARRAHDAEAANRAKSAFLTNMSHEIRTPMNAIIGLAHLLESDVAEGPQRARVQRIGQAASHLLDVISDILDLSRIEAGRIELAHEPFSLDQVVGDVLALVADDSRDGGIELVIDVDDVPNRLIGDQTRLRQILLNLVGNAVKFTEAGHVALRCEQLAAAPGRARLRFEVEDTGIGIEAADRGRLFRAFEQADASTTRRFGGTGLGLTIAYHLATLMGGEVGASDGRESGSTFWAEVELEVEPTVAATEPSAPAAAARILVADDLAVAAEALARMAHGPALAATTVASAAAAAQALRAAQDEGAPFRVVLVDWEMPGVQGAGGLVETALDSRPTWIALIARDQASTRDAAIRAGFDDVLTKPVTRPALRGALSVALGGSRPAGPPPRSAARDALRARHAGARVLVAEDNPVNQEVTRELLTEAGLQVEVADDGRRAVELAAAGAYSLILMDVQMPVTDGLQATREIRALPSCRHTPILGFSAGALAEDRAACLAAGMNDQLVKPVLPETLYSTVLRYLGRETKTTVAAAASSPAPAPDGPDADAIATLEAAGVDFAIGLVRVGGRVDTYRRMLRRFAERAPDDLSRIEAGIAAGELWAVARLAHGLRGAAGALGMSRLQGVARNLEELARSRDDDDAAQSGLSRAMVDLHAALGDVLHAIAASVGDDDAVAHTPDPGVSEAVADRLQGLLEGSDFEAVGLLESRRAELRAALGPVFDDVERLVNRFDFEDALAVLRAARTDAAPQ